MYQKIISALVLGICTYTDIRKRKIYKWSLALYSLLIVVGNLAGLVSHPFFWGEKESAAEVVSAMTAGTIPGLLCVLISRCSRQAIGYGDGILIALCGMALGAGFCIQILSAAFFFSGVWALVLVAVCRKSRKYEMPFVPFLFAALLLLFASHGFGKI